MTEDFLNRWARLKRESLVKPANRADAQTTDSGPTRLDSAPAAPIDVSTLPSIESISAQSDVAAFLGAGVPEDLTRAALRTAWVSDPTIRDFVGIAENQWDFNGEGAIAGFGALSAEEYARYVAVRTLRAENGEGTEADNGESAKVPAATVSKEPAAMPSTASAALPSRPLAQDSLTPTQISTATTVTAPESSGAPKAKRTHGSALPK